MADVNLYRHRGGFELVERRGTWHPVQNVHLAMPRLNLYAGRSANVLRGQAIENRVSTPERCEGAGERLEVVSIVGRNQVQVSSRANDSVSP